jgi:hypothetical protein
VIEGYPVVSMACAKRLRGYRAVETVSVKICAPVSGLQQFFRAVSCRPLFDPSALLRAQFTIKGPAEESKRLTDMPIADPLARFDESIEALRALLVAIHTLADGNDNGASRTVKSLAQQGLDQTDTLRAVYEALADRVDWAS